MGPDDVLMGLLGSVGLPVVGAVGRLLARVVVVLFRVGFGVTRELFSVPALATVKSRDLGRRQVVGTLFIWVPHGGEDLFWLAVDGL